MADMVDLIARIAGLGFMGLLLAAVSPAAVASEPLRIGVIGGSGEVGRRVVQEAADRGHAVTVFVRDAARADAALQGSAVVELDALDSAAVSTQASRLHVLVSAVGSGRVDGADGSLYLAVARSLVAALRTIGADAPRLIVVGGVGSLTTADGGLVLDRVPEARLAEHRGQKAALDFLRGVDDVEWTYVSPPGRLAAGTRSGSYRLGGDQLLLDASGAPAGISMEDYAVALIDEAERAQHVRKRFTVAH
jgi:uncharacterized protein